MCECGGPTLSPWPACPVGALCRGGGGGPSPGGVACHRCEGRLVSGAVPPPAARPLEWAARVPRPMCPGCGWCGRGGPAPAPQRAPLRAGVARCGGGGRASPGGGAFNHSERRLGSGTVPPPTARPLSGLLGSATHVLWARVCRCGGPLRDCPLGLHALWGLRAAGLVGGRPRGGWPATVVRGAWCQALSLPRSPVLWSGQPGFRDPCVPGAVDAGVGTQQQPHSVRPCGPGVARCGGGGRASPGGVPSTIMSSVWGQALSLPRLPAHWAGCWGSFGVCGVCGACAVRVVVCGAALLLFLWCSPLRCLGAVLCSPRACRAPFPVRAPCLAAGYPLFLSWLRCSLPFPLPFSLACTFCLPPLCCVSRSFSLPARRSLPLGLPLRTCEERGCN